MPRSAPDSDPRDPPRETLARLQPLPLSRSLGSPDQSHQHGEPAVTRERDHLPVGIGGLRADSLGQCIRHGAMHKGAEKALISPHAKVACSPNYCLPDIDGENGVRVRDLTDLRCQELRVNGSMAVSPFNVRVEI